MNKKLPGFYLQFTHQSKNLSFPIWVPKSHSLKSWILFKDKKKFSRPPAGGWPWESHWIWQNDWGRDGGTTSKKWAGGKSSGSNNETTTKYWHIEILYQYYDERRDIRENMAWAQGISRGKSPGLRSYLTLYPDLSPYRDIIPFLTRIDWFFLFSFWVQ